MDTVKTLCTKVKQVNKKELSLSRSVERRFKRQIGMYQTQCNKIGRVIESTSRDIREEQVSIKREREEAERERREAEEKRLEVNRLIVMRLRA